MNKKYGFLCFLRRVFLLIIVINGAFNGTHALAGVNHRIVGGSPAANNEYPFMVSLLEAKTSVASQAQFCGGSLIAPDWVLTAAHCVADTVAENIDVLINTNKLNGSGKRIRAIKIISHPDYAVIEKSDIALIQLSSRANTAAISLLHSGTGLDKSGKMATVIGWGLTKEAGSPSNQLLKVDVPIVSDGVCNAAHEGGVDASAEICAGFPQGGKDSCNGDSGGPLFVKNGRGLDIQVGVVSWGDKCAEPGKYGVYARVSTYVEWIEQSMEKGSSATIIEGNDIVVESELSASFTHDCVGLHCTFKAKIEGASVVSEYVWSFGDFDGWAFGQTAEFQYPQAGEYEVFLGVSTKEGKYTEITQKITLVDDVKKQVFDFGEIALDAGKRYTSDSALLEFNRELTIRMKGPVLADYDLYLERFDPSIREWLKVQAQSTPSSSETLSAKILQTATYRLQVVSYRGAGKFKLTVEIK